MLYPCPTLGPRLINYASRKNYCDPINAEFSYYSNFSRLAQVMSYSKFYAEIKFTFINKMYFYTIFILKSSVKSLRLVKS